MKLNQYICIKQEELMDCGIASLATILQYYDRNISLNSLKRISTYDNEIGTNFFQLYNTAHFLGFNAVAVNLKNITDIEYIKLPCIAQIKISEKNRHFIVIYKANNDVIIIADPSKGISEISSDEFSKKFTNKILLIQKKE